MLSLDPSNTCDNIITTPMEVSDENYNVACDFTVTTASAKTVKSPLNGSDNNNDVLQKDTELFTCDISLMTSCHNVTPNENTTLEDNNSNTAESTTSVDEEAEDEDDEETFLDTEEDLVNGECGLAKLYLNEVEIDKQEEEKTIDELVNATENDNLMKV